MRRLICRLFGHAWGLWGIWPDQYPYRRCALCRKYQQRRPTHPFTDLSGPLAPFSWWST